LFTGAELVEPLVELDPLDDDVDEELPQALSPTMTAAARPAAAVNR
jgi:hypothetical protein